MWKHKTKWLVRGGRKVKCYLCGKKILSKGDPFLFHQDTGYYSHQSCQAESTTISGNERRRAVKKIAVFFPLSTVISLKSAILHHRFVLLCMVNLRARAARLRMPSGVFQ